ncbi:MAG TPA: hypothetical protein VHU91_06060 [Mycobacteriales bacterium]|jgi:hypothetical protein|nr:hypothetical protein [Mycobacteriales bacterium]
MEKHIVGRPSLGAWGRLVLVASVGLLCVGVLAGPAGASSAKEPPTNAEKQINVFLKEYKAAVTSAKPAKTPQQVRAAYLSPELNKQLDEWAKQNHVDPVFRTQEVPQSWTTSYQGSGMGLSEVTVTEHWNDGRAVDVQYAVRLDNQQIVGLYN